MARLTDTMIKGLKPGEKRSESLDAGGSLLVKCRKSKKRVVEYYFRKRSAGEEINIKLGTTETLRTLPIVREAARTMAEKSAKVDDLKFLIAEEKRQKQEAEMLAKQERERLDNLGTLQQLCEAYREKMKSDERASWNKVYKALERYVLIPYPNLAKKKANQITADDIKLILKGMYDRGITTTVNRTRGDLHAAFKVGLTYEHDITTKRTDNLCFDLHVNPVAKIKPIGKFERALKRNLSANELSIVWQECTQYMNPVYASLLRVMICTGFHPTELMRLTIQDIDQKEKAIYMTKTKNSNPNLIILNSFAWQEVQNRMKQCGSNSLIYPPQVSEPKSDIYNRASVLSNQVAKMRQHLSIEHFTPRDIRRTVKTLMGKAGISKEMRDRLQNHAIQDVSGKHYDRYDYYTEKKKAVKTWERWLSKHVIEPDKTHSNVVSISH